MRNRILYICTAIFLLACFSFGQCSSVPGSSYSLGDDVSLSYALVVKDRALDIGHGVAVNSTHYFTQHFGFTANAEGLQMSRWTLREAAVRGGPTYRFNVGANYEPFVSVLVGYSGVSATGYFVKDSSRPHKFGGSLLVGVGTDVRLKGPLFARLTADVVDDWDAKTRFGRGTAGFAFHFGDRRGQ